MFDVDYLACAEVLILICFGLDSSRFAVVYDPGGSQVARSVCPERSRVKLSPNKRLTWSCEMSNRETGPSK
jgi:hypothetical protein